MNRTKDYGVHHRFLIPFHQIIQIARDTSMPTMTPNAILHAEYLRAVPSSCIKIRDGKDIFVLDKDHAEANIRGEY